MPSKQLCLYDEGFDAGYAAGLATRLSDREDWQPAVIFEKPGVGQNVLVRRVSADSGVRYFTATITDRCPDWIRANKRVTRMQVADEWLPID